MTEISAPFTKSSLELEVGDWIYSPWSEDNNPYGLYEVVSVSEEEFSIMELSNANYTGDRTSVAIRKSRKLCLRVP